MERCGRASNGASDVVSWWSLLRTQILCTGTNQRPAYFINIDINPIKRMPDYGRDIEKGYCACNNCLQTRETRQIESSVSLFRRQNLVKTLFSWIYTCEADANLARHNMPPSDQPPDLSLSKTEQPKEASRCRSYSRLYFFILILVFFYLWRKGSVYRVRQSWSINSNGCSTRDIWLLVWESWRTCLQSWVSSRECIRDCVTSVADCRGWVCRWW